MRVLEWCSNIKMEKLSPKIRSSNGETKEFNSALQRTNSSSNSIGLSLSNNSQIASDTQNESMGVMFRTLTKGFLVRCRGCA